MNEKRVRKKKRSSGCIEIEIGKASKGELGQPKWSYKRGNKGRGKILRTLTLKSGRRGEIERTSWESKIEKVKERKSGGQKGGARREKLKNGVEFS